MIGWLNMNAVEVSNLSFNYGKRKAIDGISFEVPQGSLFSIIGPNGSGKSTLFHLLSTLFDPTQGTIKIAGENRKDKIRAKTGIVFQSPSLDPKLTVFENLLYQGWIYGMHGRKLKNKIEELLKSLSLTDRRKERVENLSGGLKRRVEIAKAFLPEIEVLILDEPSTGLDPESRKSLWATLQNFRKKITVLITTHYLEEAEKSDQILILNKGKIITQGIPQDLKATLKGDYITIGTRSPELLSDVLNKMIGTEIYIERKEGTLRFICDNAVPTLQNLLEKSFSQLDSVTVSKPTLEDFYFKTLRAQE
jgi:ABC-2 type transport system ATP-binding protein